MCIALDPVIQFTMPRVDALPQGGTRMANLSSQPTPASCPGKDSVGVASEDSFPASDAPSWTGLVATGINKLQQSNPSSEK